MKRKQCEKCNTLISLSNFKKHVVVCTGIPPFKKQNACKHCNMSFTTEMNTSSRANHTRWCKDNPNRQHYIDTLLKNQTGNAILQTDDMRTKRKEGLRRAHARGCYNHLYDRKPFLGKTHTLEAKQKMSNKARLSKHRRLVKSVRPYTRKDGSIIMLDSSWEEALALRLDQLDVEWIRPDPIVWMDLNNISHHYYPDFYLPKYNIFLDPKNPAAMRAQKTKLDILLTQIPNLVIITTLEECKTFSPLLPSSVF